MFINKSGSDWFFKYKWYNIYYYYQDFHPYSKS